MPNWRAIVCIITSIWSEQAASFLNTFTCPRDNYTVDYINPANRRQLFMMRCDVLRFLTATTDLEVGPTDVTVAQCATVCNSLADCVAFTYETPTRNPRASALGECWGWGQEDMSVSVAFGSASEPDSATFRIGGFRAVLWEDYSQISFPPPRLHFRTTAFVTQTLLLAYPITTISTLTRTATIITAFTRTASVSTVLPDLTSIFLSTDIVPTAIVTLQILTTTIVSISTQQVVTVVESVVPRTVLNTSALENTITNTRLALPITTVQPTVQAQQTITITA
ncbi:hypothetical protein Slin15195_G063910 [Septoria linicola]|uniref:Apple domain-containing protein n=1 Tax=Septoria linicola TaxID=215465 RepID=A0A9Q9EKA9_9PEZI|nr:hypothetical protein Slin15195_G063910 [Septoria linicola]